MVLKNAELSTHETVCWISIICMEPTRGTRPVHTCASLGTRVHMLRYAVDACLNSNFFLMLVRLDLLIRRAFQGQLRTNAGNRAVCKAFGPPTANSCCQACT